MSEAASSIGNVEVPVAKRTRTESPARPRDTDPRDTYSGPDYTDRANVALFEANVPQGVRISLVQGMKGAGCHTLSATLCEYFTNQGVPYYRD